MNLKLISFVFYYHWFYLFMATKPVHLFELGYLTKEYWDIEISQTFVLACKSLCWGFYFLYGILFMKVGIEKPVFCEIALI